MAKYGSGITGHVGGKLMGMGLSLSPEQHKGMALLSMIAVGIFVLCNGAAAFCVAQFGSRKAVLGFIDSYNSAIILGSLVLPWAVLSLRAFRRRRRGAISRGAAIACYAASAIALIGADLHSEVIRETAYRLYYHGDLDRPRGQACAAAYDPDGRYVAGTEAEARYMRDGGQWKISNVEWCYQYFSASQVERFCRPAFSTPRAFTGVEFTVCAGLAEATLPYARFWPKAGDRFPLPGTLTQAEMEAVAAKVRAR